MEGKFGLDTSGDGEFEGRFKTRGEAVAAGLEKLGGRPGSFYTGVYRRLKHFIEVNAILDQLWCDAYEEAGESVEDLFTGVTDSQKQMLERILNEVLGDWLETCNIDCPRYVVRQTQHHKFNGAEEEK